MASEKEPFLDIKHLSKKYSLSKESLHVLKDIDLEIEEGKIISIIGGSGCGKSTLLRIIAGLENPTNGVVNLSGTPIQGPSSKIGLIFQEPRLFEWCTVEENIAFGLSSKIPKSEKNSIVKEYIKISGLQGFEKALPKQLSGGMKQRVNIARSLISNPKILLLDEPFGALDAFTKITMQQEVLRIWQKNKMTLLLVTHDIEEAVYLGEEVIVMSAKPGVIKKRYKIELPKPRNRTDSSFVYYRNKIYNEFFEKEITSEDYVI